MKHTNKTYIIDTSVIICDPDVLFKLHKAEIVAPAAVIKELDRLKRYPNANDPRAKAARKAVRNLDLIGNQGDISVGAKTGAGSTVRISHKYAIIDDLPSTVDNIIIGTAILLKKEIEACVTVLSNDGNVRNIVRSYGISAATYPLTLNAASFANRRLKPTMPEKRRIEAERRKFQKQGLEGKALQLMVVLVVAAILFVLLVKAG